MTEQRVACQIEGVTIRRRSTAGAPQPVPGAAGQPSEIARRFARDRRPAGAAERIGAALGGLAPDLRRTVTFDCGFEFMGYPALDRDLAVTSYFCDPRSPWQKGAVENANGRLRRYLPSDAPAERLMAESLQALADRFNAAPRRCLGYRTPAEVLNGCLGPDAGKAAARPAVSH